MTEDTPFAPCSKKGELRARLNEQLLAAHRDGKVRAALVRGPDYYGPRATKTTLYGDQVFPAATTGGTANVFGDLDARHTWICARDFARGLAEIGQHDDAMGTTWHAPCPPPLTQRALLELIYRTAGHPLRARAMPGWMTRAVGWFSPLFRELGEMQYQWEQDYDFAWPKWRARFGETFVPHEQAVRETVDWFRANPA
jgi:nucleoside-diphosphate-sugar epimerase